MALVHELPRGARARVLLAAGADAAGDAAQDVEYEVEVREWTEVGWRRSPLAPAHRARPALTGWPARRCTLSRYAPGAPRACVCAAPPSGGACPGSSGAREAVPPRAAGA